MLEDNLMVAGDINTACTHPRVTHRHGTLPCYQQDRCSCDPCRQANADYRRGRYTHSDRMDSILASEQIAGELDLTWREDAACVDTDPDVFFPETGRWATEARQICDPCPVRVECLDYAIRTNQSDGVWGGLTVKERAKVRRRAQVTA